MKVRLRIFEYNATFLEEDWQEADLIAGNMNTLGQLNAELALSDSDEDDDLVSAKRARYDDDLDTF